MKINEPIWINQPTTNFKGSPKKGDEYFWCHQQQLENSALQFKPFDLETKVKNTSFEKEMSALKMHRPIEQKMRQPFLEIQATKFHELKPSTRIPKIELRVLPDCLLSPQILKKAVPTNFCMLPKPKIPDSIDFSTVKILPRAFIFKEYQLFISKDETELSLNGANLARQEMKELVRLIKKWFFNQGIKLDKLIINGEPQ